MASFYVIVNPHKPDKTVDTYAEMLACLESDSFCKAYRYRKARDGIMKPSLIIKLLGGFPNHRILSVFECPTEYLTYPTGINACKCGWKHMQGSTCMRCDWDEDYCCPDCGVNNMEGVCLHMCPNWANF
jgi:hypothetical protein